MCRARWTIKEKGKKRRARQCGIDRKLRVVFTHELHADTVISRLLLALQRFTFGCAFFVGLSHVQSSTFGEKTLHIMEDEVLWGCVFMWKHSVGSHDVASASTWKFLSLSTRASRGPEFSFIFLCFISAHRKWQILSSFDDNALFGL